MHRARVKPPSDVWPLLKSDPKVGPDALRPELVHEIQCLVDGTHGICPAETWLEFVMVPWGGGRYGFVFIGGGGR